MAVGKLELGVCGGMAIEATPPAAAEGGGARSRNPPPDVLFLFSFFFVSRPEGSECKRAIVGENAGGEHRIKRCI